MTLNHFCKINRRKALSYSKKTEKLEKIKELEQKIEHGRNGNREELMEDYKLGTMELRFAELIWNYAPISSGELVKLCEKELSWKKSTTYTMLRRLCQRGIFENQGGSVQVLQTKKEFQSGLSEQFVKESFGGSLPSFLAAFTARKKLSEREVEELRRLIEENRRKED